MGNKNNFLGWLKEKLSKKPGDKGRYMASGELVGGEHDGMPVYVDTENHEIYKKEGPFGKVGDKVEFGSGEPNSEMGDNE